MSQLKEKMKVVMLPTEKESTLRVDDGHLELSTSKLCQNTINYQYQHLYVVSDKEIVDIETRAWYYYPNDAGGLITQIEGRHSHPVFNISHTEGYGTLDKYRKVIATTDKSLGLPLIPEGFVRKYVELQEIDEVMVDMATGYNKWHNDIPEWIEAIVPKVDKNNYITLSKVKDSWTKEEVLHLIEDFTISTHHIPLNKHPERENAVNKWIENNL